MNMRYAKIGVVVIGLAVLTYVFFPVSAKQGKGLTQSEQSVATGSQQAKSKTVWTHKTRQTQRNQLAKKSRKTHVNEARIEPDTTLRKEGIHHRRSGPPSKMYGGL